MFFISHEALDAGRAELVPGQEEGFTEVQGAPDMVLEIVSPSSVKDDTETLRELYWDAGVPEYWLVDARGPHLQFDILKWQAKGYTVTRKQKGRLRSQVFGASFELKQDTDRRGHPRFQLVVS